MKYTRPDLIASGQPDSADVNKLAGALASVLREREQCTMQAMGANAVNKAVKAIIVASGYVSPTGLKVQAEPHFVDANEGRGEEKTAIRWNCRLVNKE